MLKRAKNVLGTLHLNTAAPQHTQARNRFCMPLRNCYCYTLVRSTSTAVCGVVQVVCGVRCAVCSAWCGMLDVVYGRLHDVPYAACDVPSKTSASVCLISSYFSCKDASNSPLSSADNCSI